MSLLIYLLQADQQTRDLHKKQLAVTFAHVYAKRDLYLSTAIPIVRCALSAMVRGISAVSRGLLAVLALARHPSGARFAAMMNDLVQLGQLYLNTIKSVFELVVHTCIVAKNASTLVFGEEIANVVVLCLLLLCLMVLTIVWSLFYSVTAGFWGAFTGTVRLLWNLT